MASDAEVLLAHLQAVAQERALRAADPGLAARVQAVKAYQHGRFARTYADLLAQPRYAAAARFFLDELYGPRDFSDRDAQFARIVPALTRLFSEEIVATVRDLAELHALSEGLDSAMARAIDRTDLDAESYGRAWRQVGRRGDRDRQVELMLRVGRALDRYTGNRLLRQSLKLMRAPARAAGLAALHSFLESGFDTFRAMRGAADFLATVSGRESRLIDELFAGLAAA